jgi:hypothetical protein
VTNDEIDAKIKERRETLASLSGGWLYTSIILAQIAELLEQRK